MTNILLVGGFLGAGKTTLIASLAKKLNSSGKKVGLITNDQAAALVDTRLLAKSNAMVEEVSGSCFCCNYNGFTSRVEKLIDNGANYIIAEPVGSCTDLSATILQPIKSLEKNRLHLEALCVLIDPDRIGNLLDNACADIHPSALYIMRKQLEEADIIVISKADKCNQDTINILRERVQKAFPGKPVLAISALTGAGIDNLLQAIDAVKKPGSHIAQVDYDIYAEGEAVLGWLNMEIALEKPGTDWHEFASKLLHEIASSFKKDDIAIAHIKLLIEGSKSHIIGNITGGTITVTGRLSGENAVTLILNARAQTNPENLLAQINALVANCCKAESIVNETRTVNCLMPGRPSPTHRHKETVE